MPFFTPMSRIEEHIQTQTAELTSVLEDVISAIGTLTAAVNVLDGHVDTSEATLTAILAKLGGGLPSALNSDRLKTVANLL
jgi:hypothetical protein